MGYIWMMVPLLPLAAAVTIGAILVGILGSIITKISNLPQPSTAQSAIEPVVGGILAVYGLAVIVFLGVSLLGALSFYYLMDRRNRHFIRQQLLFSTLHRYLASKLPTSENVAQVGYLSEDCAYEERTRPAGLWALLFIVLTPIVALIASYSLTQDLRKHDELQSKYQAALTASLVEAGFQQPNFPAYNSRKRDPVLFVILYAITGGLFWIYWYYTLLKDYNEHFAEQAKFEDQILRLIIPPQVEKRCGTCGGAVPAGARFCPNCGSQQTA
jgi:MFS family permease